MAQPPKRLYALNWVHVSHHIHVSGLYWVLGIVYILWLTSLSLSATLYTSQSREIQIRTARKPPWGEMLKRLGILTNVAGFSISPKCVQPPPLCRVWQICAVCWCITPESLQVWGVELGQHGMTLITHNLSDHQRRCNLGVYFHGYRHGVCTVPLVVLPVHVASLKKLGISLVASQCLSFPASC